MTIAPHGGIVALAITPSATFNVKVARSGHVYTSVNGQADSTGHASVAAGYDSGTGPNIHNGDTVTVTDNGLLGAAPTTYVEQVNLVGMLDEFSGVLKGTAAPGAVLSVSIYTSGAAAQPVASNLPVVADSSGYYSLTVGNYVPTPAQTDPSIGAWRGYIARITSTDTPGEAVQMDVQTVNTTLVSTRNAPAAADLLPGDVVTFTLSRGGMQIDSVQGTADGDGIAQAASFPTASVQAGDVFAVQYHWASGSGLTLDTPEVETQLPWNLTAQASQTTHAVSGTTAPNALLRAYYHGASGVVESGGQADANGNYSLKFPSIDGNRLVTIWRVSDPGATGVAVQLQELMTPVTRLVQSTGEVSGYDGSNGVVGVTVYLVRNGSVVDSVSSQTSKSGKYDVRLHVLPAANDTLNVAAGGFWLPAYALGPRALSAASTHGSAGIAFSGQGTAGRTVTVSNGRTCATTATVSSSGTWATPAAACFTAGQGVSVTETIPDGLAASGSLRLIYITA